MLALKPAETAYVRDAQPARVRPVRAVRHLPARPGTAVAGAGTGRRRARPGRAAAPGRVRGRDRTRHAPGWRRLRAAFALVGVGLPFALAAFWLFPRLARAPLWGTPGMSQARPGLSETMSPGEWVDLLSDDSPALRVQFFGATPANTQFYWRGYTFWDFDGRTWTQARWIDAMPPAAVVPSAQRWEYQVELEPTDRRQSGRARPAAGRARRHRARPRLRPGRRPTADRTAPLAHAFGVAGGVRNRPVPGLAERRARLPPGYNRARWRWRNSGATRPGDDAAIVRRALAMFHDRFAYTWRCCPRAGTASTNSCSTPARATASTSVPRSWC